MHWCLLLLHFDGTGGGSKGSKGDPFMLIDIFIGFPIYRVVALQHGKQANGSPFFSSSRLPIESKHSVKVKISLIPLSGPHIKVSFSWKSWGGS